MGRCSRVLLVLEDISTRPVFTRVPEAPNGTSLVDQDFGISSVGLVRGMGQYNLDLAVERTFPVTESSSFQFRTEFFNLTNTPQFLKSQYQPWLRRSEPFRI